MTDLASILFEHGQTLVFLVPLLSCLALPVPASAIFMLAGTLAAEGDMDLQSVWIAGFAGAVIGDQIGFWGSRYFSARFRLLSQKNRAIHLGLERAAEFTKKHGGMGVFLSRWLASPLGPYINFTSGLTRYNWSRFLFWGALGEAIWVSLYIGIGYAFSAQAQAIADMVGNVIWLLIAAGITVLLGRKLFSRS